jgi:gamma-glutamyl-gamma-aminobutyrate hydrolase PuuD
MKRTTPLNGHAVVFSDAVEFALIVRTLLDSAPISGVCSGNKYLGSRAKKSTN